MNLLLLAQAADAASRVGSGFVTGGLSYVYAGYALTLCCIGLYALSLVLRRPTEPLAPPVAPEEKK